VNAERLRQLLCELQDEIQRSVLRARDESTPDELARVVEVTEADSIYQLDHLSEATVLDWFRERWPAELPVELVMEGLEGRGPVVFPERVAVEATVAKCIVDPVDGTRGLMYDKRSAWVLAAVAPQRGPKTRLSDLVAAAMTELPPAKQRRADQVSAIRGMGRAALVARRRDLDSGEVRAFSPRPSRARDLPHGFAAFARFFPEGKGLLAQFEEALWERLYGHSPAPLIFEDQYISTGGQFYELLVGHDRMAGDLRPLALATLHRDSSPVCHPHDACTSLILEEGGCRLTDPHGAPLDAPLDTVSPVAWVGFANAELEAHVRPAFDALLESFFPRDEAG
jgi:hypothetical protein